MVAYAIFRHDLLGTGFTTRTVRSGTLATGALAALFNVAQVSLESFAAEYGLLLGGVVAGALIFAAHPIQRAMEHLAGHEGPRSLHHGASSPDAMPSPDADREHAYREAVGPRSPVLTRRAAGATESRPAWSQDDLAWRRTQYLLLG